MAQHGLTEDQYQRILGHLEREPNLTELGIYSVMWSEHGSDKISRGYLKRLPTGGERGGTGAGGECRPSRYWGWVGCRFQNGADPLQKNRTSQTAKMC